jgi:hypothetical protein
MGALDTARPLAAGWRVYARCLEGAVEYTSSRAKCRHQAELSLPVPNFFLASALAHLGRITEVRRYSRKTEATLSLPMRFGDCLAGDRVLLVMQTCRP